MGAVFLLRFEKDSFKISKIFIVAYNVQAPVS